MIIDPIEVHKNLITLNREGAYKYRWGWAWPVFGMSLQAEGRIEKLFRPEGFENYFTPPSSVPFVVFDGHGVYTFDDNFTTHKGGEQ